MRTRDALLALVQELDGDAELIARVLTRNNTAWGRILAGADDPVDWGALGFTIQTLYGVLENYFLRISRLFESSLPRDRWHMALVEKMSLDIPGVRPAFLTDPSHLRECREILRFRHRLRNLYGEDLDPIRPGTFSKRWLRFLGASLIFTRSSGGNWKALPMTFDPERYAAGTRRANEREQIRIRDQLVEARAEALRIATQIGQRDSSVRSVTLFGSVAAGNPRAVTFDIDLALEGGDLYHAMEVAESSSRSVDIVDIQRLPDHVRARIQETGTVLYRRNVP